MDLGYEHLPQTWDMSILRGPGIRAFSRFWNMSIILPANSHVQPSPWGPGGGGHIILWADPHVQPSPWGPGGGGHIILWADPHVQPSPWGPGGGGHIILWADPHVQPSPGPWGGGHNFYKVCIGSCHRGIILFSMLS